MYHQSLFSSPPPCLFSVLTCSGRAVPRPERRASLGSPLPLSTGASECSELMNKANIGTSRLLVREGLLSGSFFAGTDCANRMPQAPALSCGWLKPRASPPHRPTPPFYESQLISLEGRPPRQPRPSPIGLPHCTWAPPRLSSGAGPALGQAGAGSGCNYTLPPRTGCHCWSDSANSAGPKCQGRSWKRARPGAPALERSSFPEGREFPRLGNAGSLSWLLVTSRDEGRRSWVSVPIPAWQPLGTIVPFKPGH